MKKWIGLIALLLLVFIAGVLTNHYWHSGLNPPGGQQGKKIIYWVAPMDPTYRRDKPGKSPMGMDLVPVYADGENKEQYIVRISPTVENNLGVKIATVKLKDLARIINTVGYVMVDENNIEHIHTYTEGWIKKLNVRTTGELVKKGQLLLELYSPILNNAQEELLLALKNKNPVLIDAGEKKLVTLGMAQSQINQLKQTRKVMEHIKVYATQNGVVSLLNVREGTYIKPDMEVMTIEDLTQIWIIAEVFERQSAWVKAGQDALATLGYMPEKIWQGKVDYVYPELDEKTHTLRVRLVFPNPDLTLKPHMYANVTLFSQVIKNALAIPRAALIQTEEGARVVQAIGKGRFKVQAVTVGIESGDYYQILTGLKPGEQVVTSAQFLLDSESNIDAGFSRMQSQEQSKQHPSNDSPKEFAGMGTVEQIDDVKRMLLLHHQPIPGLNMPAMTMELKVDEAINLKMLKAGDEVNFLMIKQPNNTYLLTKIQMKPMK
jgi:Cu(I)/Ag(I) efflux system membrane fusion protein